MQGTKEKFEIDHVDIVTSHRCNKRCAHCIDSFLGTTRDTVSLADIEAFLGLVDEYTGGRKLTVLLLGGEPTVLPKGMLEKTARVIHAHGHKASMSTNGLLVDRVKAMCESYDSVQITIDELDEMEKWADVADKVNLKLCGDDTLTMEKLDAFAVRASGFQRRSLTMYFDEETAEELCTDVRVWEVLDGLDWKRNGSYLYSFYRDIRIKRCIPGETNVIDEPTIPKLYPNGNYNRTWCHEELDDYLSAGDMSWEQRRNRIRRVSFSSRAYM